MLLTVRLAASGSQSAAPFAAILWKLVRMHIKEPKGAFQRIKGQCHLDLVNKIKGLCEPSREYETT